MFFLHPVDAFTAQGWGDSLMKDTADLQDFIKLLLVLHNQNVGLTVGSHILASFWGIGGVNSSCQPTASEKHNQSTVLLFICLMIGQHAFNVWCHLDNDYNFSLSICVLRKNVPFAFNSQLKVNYYPHKNVKHQPFRLKCQLKQPYEPKNFTNFKLFLNNNDNS